MSLFSKTLRAALVATSLCGLTVAAHAAGDPNKPKPTEYDWSFAGPMGMFDRAQLQRGFKVYQNICAGCHSLELLSFRNLAEPGGPEFTEDEAKAIAEQYFVMDGPNTDGEMFERPGKLSDRFPPLFANKNEAVAIHGAYPPDFSLIAKARAAKRGFPTFVFDIFTQYAESGPDYITSLMLAYDQEIPEGVEPVDGAYYNPIYLGGDFIKMGPQLYDDSIEYTDGTPMTAEQYAKDVAAFLMWAAEPKMEERKRAGLQVMMFLAVFATLLFLLKRRIWARVKH